MKDKMVIVDGNSLINRAYFALKELKNSKGVYTGGVFGLTSMLFKLIDTFEPAYMCVAFDLKGPTFRHTQYEAYKGTRKGMPPELAMQMPIAKDILDALGIARMELQGYEADDLIGTMARQALDRGIEPHIITGDKDALQLVAIGAQVHITKKGISQLKCYDDAEVMAELGVHAEQVIDYKGLSGDTSDNIPGIPGVGPKTAAKLIEQFGTVESIIAHSDAVENKRIRGLIETYAEQAVLSKHLATIMLEIPVEIDFDATALKPFPVERSVEILKTYELNSLLEHFKKEPNAAETSSASVTYEVRDAEAIKAVLEGEKGFAFHLFYDAVGVAERALAGAVFLPLEEGATPLILAEADAEALAVLAPIFEAEHPLKMGYGVKSDYLYLMEKGMDLNGVIFDGYIAAYLLDAGRRGYALSDVAFEQAMIALPSEDTLLGKGAKRKTYAEVSEETLHLYMAQYVQAAHALYAPLSRKLEEAHVSDLFETVELPLIKILADIEHTGFLVDPDEIDALDTQLIEQIDTLEARIYTLAGKTFNINSPKQLGAVLFEDLGLPPVKKTKTGYSTSHDVLEQLSETHEIAAELIEYRTYTKLKSTYIDGLRAVIDPRTSRVHTSLNQTVTVTGRLSSTEPNLQNIPIRLPYGRKIRRIFVADPGSRLLGADYSQIELRVLAHLSGDARLKSAFQNDLDIHTITASEVFDVPEAEVTRLQRSHAKEVNFGIVYGMGDFGLSQSIGTTRKKAAAYIKAYFETYPGVEAYMNGIIAGCKEKGYVETVLHRRRGIPDIDASNFMLRSAAERIARNTPIQGSAADIIKLAMIRVYEALKAGGYAAKLQLQVHDELILNVPEQEMEAVSHLLKQCMEEAFELSVPLKVDMNDGKSWYDAK